MPHFGPSDKQKRRLAKLPWTAFQDVIQALSLSLQNFARNQPPAEWVAELESQCEVLQTVGEGEIEFAIITSLQRSLAEVILNRLGVSVPMNEEDGPTPAWYSLVWSGFRQRGVTAPMILAARDEGLQLPESPTPNAALSGHVNLEQIMGKRSTLLPIHILEVALKRAATVARIECETSRGISWGSGFVIPGNLLVTNAHVIGALDTAQKANVFFNDQKDLFHKDLKPQKVALAPSKFFRSSPVAEFDLSVIALAEEPQGRWCEAPLGNGEINVDDFVYIIQHPGGQQKHIGMSNNVVTYRDDRLLHYLTDTLPGSSGSPVFNDRWEVVGIHHAGGWLQEPNSKRTLYRNEGIRVSHLRSLLDW